MYEQRLSVVHEAWGSDENRKQTTDIDAQQVDDETIELNEYRSERGCSFESENEIISRPSNGHQESGVREFATEA